MTNQTALGVVLTPATSTHINGRSTRGSAVFMDSPLPLRSPAVSLRYSIRRGIGCSLLGRASNATRDFSDSSGAFRAGTDCSVLMWRLRSSSSHFRLVTATLICPFGPCSERLSTLPGDVPLDAPSRGALLFPIHGQRKAVYSETLQGVVQKSEIAAGRSIGPSRRPMANRTARTAHTAAEPHSRTLKEG